MVLFIADNNIAVPVIHSDALKATEPARLSAGSSEMSHIHKSVWSEHLDPRVSRVGD